MKMTLEEVDTMHSSVDNGISIADALRGTLLRAKEQSRITCGVYDTAKRMEVAPENIMLCVMAAEDVSDVTKQIHLTLMEALCWENEVRLLKVDSSTKLAKLIGDVKPIIDNNGNQRTFKSDDLKCLLIEYPPDELSTAEENIIEYYKLVCNTFPHPIVPLPA
ncbi:growth arrest and DNA damage-inducible protein GADD45 alpha-like [Lineus longissimus]|uniref:growth arrest and DNA damage-inducible protein GADD45 alpha-like n=1 Tax=Lineus longissimus TaxID=88925 RepID=UPI002B4D0688